MSEPKPGMTLSMLMYSSSEQKSQVFQSSLLYISEVYNGVICTSLTILKLKAMKRSSSFKYITRLVARGGSRGFGQTPLVA